MAQLHAKITCTRCNDSTQREQDIQARQLANWQRFLQDNPDLGVELQFHGSNGFLGSMVDVIRETGDLTLLQREVVEGVVLQNRKQRAQHAVQDMRERLARLADKSQAAAS